MYTQMHDNFQFFFDTVIERNDPVNKKINIIKEHLLTHQTQYEQMLLFFFKDETLNDDNYFYITYTYHDLPIDLEKEQEFVLSMLYDLDHEMYFELVVFNVDKKGNEIKEVFSRFTDYYN